jgi:ribosomal L1p/L10e-like protein
MVVGKASFDEKQLAENCGAAIDAVLRHKPSSSKGPYLKKITVSTTTGPGIPVDPSITRNFAEAEAPSLECGIVARVLCVSRVISPHSAAKARRCAGAGSRGPARSRWTPTPFDTR